MRKAAFLFELSGEHPTLPTAEVLATIGAECEGGRKVITAPGLVVSEFDSEKFPDISNRLGLSHRSGRYLGSCKVENVIEFASKLVLPEGSIAVRARNFQGNMKSLSPSELSRKVGAVLAKERRVDLINPDLGVRMIISDGIHFFIEDHVIDRTQFEKRKVGLRPFFSPISLHPKFARALVNLTGVRRGERLLDPFCGTGGILIEASLMGVKAIGSDISEDMVKGCQENMEHFGAEFEQLERGDVGEIHEIFGKVKFIATDPPYGRSTTTMREDIEELYLRMMESFTETMIPSGGLGLVLPKPCVDHPPGLILEENHMQRVHRSLTRHYCKFRRGPQY
jgi:tRNA (guanine10-N2)-dimethyltransferase